MLLALGPMFRLLQACTRMLKDNTLASLEGLLGCPLLFYPPSLLDGISLLYLFILKFFLNYFYVNLLILFRICCVGG